MFSFTKISAFAALAFAAISSVSALPTADVGALVAADVNVKAGLDIFDTHYHPRDVVTKKSITVIFTETITQVTPVCNEFKYIKTENATVEGLTPLVNQLRTILGGALNDILALSGEANTVILAPVEGTVLVTVAELAQLIASLLTLILEALGFVLTVVDKTALTAVTALLVTVGELLGCCCCGCFSVVGGLLAGIIPAVFGLIGGVVSVVLNLGVFSIISIFNIPC